MRDRERRVLTSNFFLFVGHLKGTEILKQQYERSSLKANQSRTPLHPVQQKSTTKSTPTNIAGLRKSTQCTSQKQSTHRLISDTLVPSKRAAATDQQGIGVSTVLSSKGCSEETSFKHQDCHSECNNDRKPSMKREDATASTSSHLKKHLHGQNSKQLIEQLPQSSPTRTNNEITGNSITPLATAAVTMTTWTKEGSTEVTPERSALSCGSVAKRKLKLEEGASYRPQTKRRRTSTRDSSGSGKKLVAMLGSPLQRENSGQRTMQSYFQPV